MHKFNPQNIGLLLDEEREKEMSPETFLREWGLKEGMVFADIGCGPGFFSIPAALIVGSTGAVYSIDIEEEMLEELKKRDPMPNVFLIKSEENSIQIEDGKADLALLAYVLHEAENKAIFLKEVKRIVKGEGGILILDWEKKEEEKGPPFEERLERREAIQLLEDAGFLIEEVSSITPSHYRISAVKTSAKGRDIQGASS